MEQKVIVLIPVGKPGSGKETVQKMISSYVKTKLGKKVFFSDTGALFLQSLNGPNGLVKMNEVNREIIKKRQSSGKLQPTALAITMWCTYFSAFYNLEPFIIMDGSPRRIEELPIVTQYMKEMFDADIHFINIEITDEVAIQRMQERHLKKPREDTSTIEKIRTRLQQYETLNRPTLEHIKTTEKSFTIISNNTTLEELECIVYGYLDRLLQ